MQNCIGDLFDGSSHSIGRIHSTDDGRPTLVAHFITDTNALDIGHSNKVLPHFACQTGVVKLFTQDGISLTQGVQSVSGNGTQAADTQTRAGERLTVNHVVRQAQSLTYHADFILKQQLNRLNQFHGHLVGQTTDIMMGLDGLSAFSRLNALKNVRINGTLSQERDTIQLGSFFIKHLDELSTDDLALALGVSNTCQQIQEPIGGIYIDQVGVQLLAEDFDDLLALALTHKAVVHMDTNQLLAHCLDQQSSYNRGIDTAGQSQKAPELEGLPQNTMTIEGTLVVDPEGKLISIMRFGKFNTALVYEVNTTDRDAPLKFSRLMDFSANYSKFMIKYDESSGYYYTVATRVYDEKKTSARDLLSLMRSKDLRTWEVVTDLFDYRDRNDTAHVGFQYVDFAIEGNDLLFLCRTALNGANSFHDSNYSTFHRIKDFRDL